MYLNALMTLCVVFMTFCLNLLFDRSNRGLSSSASGVLMDPVQTFCCKRTNLSNPEQILSWKGLCCIEENWHVEHSGALLAVVTSGADTTVSSCAATQQFEAGFLSFPLKMLPFHPWNKVGNVLKSNSLTVWQNAIFPQEKVCKALLIWTGTVFQRGPQSPLLSSIWQVSVRFRSHSAEPWSCNASLMLFKAVS